MDRVKLGSSCRLLRKIEWELAGDSLMVLVCR